MRVYFSVGRLLSLDLSRFGRRGGPDNLKPKKMAEHDASGHENPSAGRTNFLWVVFPFTTPEKP